MAEGGRTEVTRSLPTECVAMSEAHGKLLRRSKAQLVRRMDPHEVLLRLSEAVLTAREVEEVRSNPTDASMNEALLDFLKTKDDSTFDVFTKSLEDTLQGYLVAVLLNPDQHVEEIMSLKAHQVDLVTNLDPAEVLNWLLQMKVLTQLQMERIKASPVRAVQNEALLELLQKKDEVALRVFLRALQETGQAHLADLVDPEHKYTSTDQQEEAAQSLQEQQLLQEGDRSHLESRHWPPRVTPSTSTSAKTSSSTSTSTKTSASTITASTSTSASTSASTSTSAGASSHSATIAMSLFHPTYSLFRVLGKKTFKAIMKKTYQEKLQYLRPMLWDHKFKKPIKEVYTRVTISPIGDDAAVHREQIIEDNLPGILNRIKGQKAALRIVIQGNPAVGKTTLTQKLAYDWASHKCNAKRTDCISCTYEFLILLKARNLTNDKGIYDLQQYLTVADMTDFNEQCIWTYFRNNQDKILFIIDGLDEVQNFNTIPGLQQLLSKDIFPNSQVIATTRPLRSIDTARAVAVHDADIYYQILGFNNEMINQYAQATLQDEDQRKGFLDLLEQNQKIQELCSTPLFTFTLCEMYKHKSDTTHIKSLHDIYKQLITFIIDRACHRDRHDGQTETDKKSINSTWTALAWDRLVSANNHIVFSQDDTKIPLNDLATLGLIFPSEEEFQMQEEKYFVFPHLSIQEYLAACHLAATKDRKLIQDAVRSLFSVCSDGPMYGLQKHDVFMNLLPDVLASNLHEHDQQIPLFIGAFIEQSHNHAQYSGHQPAPTKELVEFILTFLACAYSQSAGQRLLFDTTKIIEEMHIADVKEVVLQLDSTDMNTQLHIAEQVFHHTSIKSLWLGANRLSVRADQSSTGDQELEQHPHESVWPVVVKKLQAPLTNRTPTAPWTIPLRCQIHRGNAPPRWFKDGTLLKKSDKYEMEDKDEHLTLRINNVVRSADHGEYRCRVSNKHGSAETACKLDLVVRCEKQCEVEIDSVWIAGLGKLQDDRLWVVSSDSKQLYILEQGPPSGWHTVAKHKIPQCLGAVHHLNRVWLTGYRDGGLYSVGVDGDLSTICPKGTFNEPCGVSLTRQGELLIVDAGAVCLVWCRTDGTVTRRLPLPREHITRPWSAVQTEDNNLLIADSLLNKVVSISHEGEVLTSYTASQTGSVLDEPWFISQDQYGNVLVVENGGHRVHLLDASCRLQQVLLSEAGGIEDPTCLFVDEVNHLLYVGQWNGNIQIFTYTY